MADSTHSSRLVLLARLLAEHFHEGQLRRDGAPYFDHCEQVAARVRERGDHARIVAYLHDLVEDTDATVELVALIFGQDVADDVDALTRSHRLTYEEYVARVSEGSDAVVLVKLADVQHNILGAPASLMDRYRRAHEVLVEEAAARGLLHAGRSQRVSR